MHCDSATAARLSDAAWQIAARAAAAHIAVTEHVPAPQWVDASERTRGMVIGVLADREQTTVEDLFEAFARADPQTTACMMFVVAYVTTRLPSDSWGSYQAVERWIVNHRKRLTAERELSRHG